MINEMGGINGRKNQSHQRRRRLQPSEGGRTNSPPRRTGRSRVLFSAVLARQAIQRSAPTSTTIRSPQLFLIAATGASMFGDPKHFPWTMGGLPNYQTEAHIFAKHILASKPDAKIGVLYQNDSVRQGLCGSGCVDGLVGSITLRWSSRKSPTRSRNRRSRPRRSSRCRGPERTRPSSPRDFRKAAAQTIRKAYDVGWKAGSVSELSWTIDLTANTSSLRGSTSPQG